MFVGFLGLFFDTSCFRCSIANSSGEVLELFPFSLFVRRNIATSKGLFYLYEPK